MLTKVLYLGQDRPAADFIGARLGLVYSVPFEVLALFEGGERVRLLGGFVFTSRSAANVDVSLYAPGCLNRRLMAAGAALVFDTWHLQRATARCRRSNHEMRKLMERAGWQYEGTQRRYFGPTKADDAMVYGILATTCVWGNHGRTGTTSGRTDGGTASTTESTNGGPTSGAWPN